jgi:hypothetical protein
MIGLRRELFFLGVVRRLGAFFLALRVFFMRLS